MAQCAKDNWQIKFRRMMNQEVYTEWTKLTKLLEATKITDTEDMTFYDDRLAYFVIAGR
jgi:hypothetical protein